MEVAPATKRGFYAALPFAGMEAAFYLHVKNVMIPLWSQFPEVREVRVLTQESADIGDPAYPLVMVMRFDSHEDIEQALLSAVRAESKRESAVLIAMFEGTIFHTVFNHLYPA
ncbi:hypothetical protein [Raoultella sp. BIGb0138]|uniref:hypothetical protein n=1 Tax=Raoultella sp. BIGb0138 TaxID=2485115 RepID=UPI001A9DE690|nr:hypothetical protein [Raoultella sp. BIGb0138]